MEKILDKLTNIGIEVGIKLLVSIILLIIGTKIINTLIKLLRKENKLTKLDLGVKGFLVSFINVVLKVLLFVTVLAIFSNWACTSRWTF